MKKIKTVEKELKKLEKLLLKPEARKSFKVLTELLHDNFIEFGSSGKIYTKEKIIKALQIESKINLKLTSFKLTELGNNHFLVTYRISKKVNDNNYYSLRSSIWLKTKNEYQIIFHQGTNINQ